MKAYLITMLILFAGGLLSDSDDKPSKYPGTVKLVQAGMLSWTIYLLCQL